jgi:hypothetical protein
MVFALMAWRFKLKSAIVGAALVILPGVEELLPKGPLQWGIFVLSMGFIALIVGIIINFRQRTSKLLESDSKDRLLTNQKGGARTVEP